MTNAPAPSAKHQSQTATSRLPSLRVVLSIVIIVATVGWGARSAILRQADQVNHEELDEELAFLEMDGADDGDQSESGAAMSADVVTAAHLESAGDSSSVELAGFTVARRPDSDSAVWLMGTIEEVTSELPQWPERAAASSGQRESSPFSVK